MHIWARLTVLSVLALLLTPAHAQTRISAWKGCEGSYRSCEKKCPPPIYLAIKDAPDAPRTSKVTGNPKYISCIAKCSDNLNACVSTALSNGAPECRVQRDCPRQADGAPTLCVSGKCVLT
jgi:hypothetical protein